MSTEVPEFLFHTVLAVTDFSGSSSSSARNVYVLGTHSTLAAAKHFTQSALTESLHFDPSDFVLLKHASDAGFGSDGDGVVVFAKAISGQQLVLAIATTRNTESLAATQDGGVVVPGGSNHLHYVLQTSVDYGKDRSGLAQSTDVEGCFVRREDAVAAARACLAANKTDFAQFDERSNLGASDDWPFGEDAIVHAVSHYGENFIVSVAIPPDSKTVHKMSHRKKGEDEQHAHLESGVGLGIAV